MIKNKIIEILAEFLSVDKDEFNSNTNLIMEYSFTDNDIEEIIEKFNDYFDIEIDFDEFSELETIREITEYIEELV